MKKPFCLVLLTTLLLSGTWVQGQEPLRVNLQKKARTAEDYKPRTLKEIAELGSTIASEHDDHMKGDATTLVHGDLQPSRVRLTYKGSARPIPKLTKDVISQWANKYAGDPQHYIGPYTTEVLFSEGRIKHWLVVNKNVIPRLKRELKPRTAVDLYLIRLGAIKNRGKWTWVLLVEDFAK